MNWDEMRLRVNHIIHCTFRDGSQRVAAWCGIADRSMVLRESDALYTVIAQDAERSLAMALERRFRNFSA
jgi:hypothetical protein